MLARLSNTNHPKMYLLATSFLLNTKSPTLLLCDLNYLQDFYPEYKKLIYYQQNNKNQI